jgi:DNA polymerase-3 subunit chi
MIVDFYHLSASPLERVLPAICEKLLASGDRLLVVAEGELLARIDDSLWSYSPDSFLPHGIQAAAAQPILLSADAVPANGARNVVLADGAWREAALDFERVFYFFDSAHLDEARGAWRTLKSNSQVQPRYWKQDEAGKWVQGP